MSERIIAKIRALRAKKVDAGATEAEAEAAAAMAADLMQRYQIEESDVEAAAYDRMLLRIKGVNLHPRKSHPLVFVGHGVSHITGCSCFLSSKGMYVVGDEVGREMAGYLFDMTRNVIDAAWAVERKRRMEDANKHWLRVVGRPMPKKLSRKVHDALRDVNCAFDAIARRSFGMGMAMRMSDRMEQMPPARKPPEEAVKRIMSDKVDTPVKRKRSKNLDYTAIDAGLEAGKSAPIGLGVNATAPSQRVLAHAKGGA